MSSKHEAMSDRLRNLAAEWRRAETSAPRREAIRVEIELFTERFAWLSRAHSLLYVATACFIAMVLVIAVAPLVDQWLAIELLSLPLLVGGAILMLLAMFFELRELRQAHATIEIESRGIESREIAAPAPISQKPSNLPE
ncbi:MAG TPA: DUF2721 domain-containing protein [Bryobacteraceae bacterium]|nr:DUF2721 domain-containing protein [Bryobacteraceae bacterium]